MCWQQSGMLLLLPTATDLLSFKKRLVENRSMRSQVVAQGDCEDSSQRAGAVTACRPAGR